MLSPSIGYRAGYKYQLAETYIHHFSTSYFTPFNAEIKDFIRFTGKTLTIFSGYAWDGPSGPTIDTKNFMRGSLVHDALYQLMREGYLNPDFARKWADDILRDICLEDGMSRLRAWWVYKGVRIFGKSSALSSNISHPIQRAP